MQSDLEKSEEEELNEEDPDEEALDLAGEVDLAMGPEHEVQEDHLSTSREPIVRAGSRDAVPRGVGEQDGRKGAPAEIGPNETRDGRKIG
ncbi:hypothetical protein NDU88_007207 [Pleurodeles waltl]|uniref:Uncharacterized protein n=1 Tax=Pleurodeles waltl TaxID=8319 RepID=A0AAV7SS48_PLEWA|nr:hypothetical protein NDU88_007207 [Pleurodeles waltl]